MRLNKEWVTILLFIQTHVVSPPFFVISSDK